MPLVALSAALLAACSPAAIPPTGATTITNVLIVDGTGAAARRGAVRIFADSIVAVGEGVKPVAGDSVVDGGGRVLAPGFIDTHSHHDD